MSKKTSALAVSNRMAHEGLAFYRSAVKDASNNAEPKNGSAKHTTTNGSENNSKPQAGSAIKIEKEAWRK